MEKGHNHLYHNHYITLYHLDFFFLSSCIIVWTVKGHLTVVV